VRAKQFPAGSGSRAGFTLVEVALCLGIIVFALVAILGVLPTGMKVQQENLEDTVVNQDGKYLLEAIRSGSRGSDELTNYVESITIQTVNGPTVVYTNGVPAGSMRQISNGQQIVGLLSTPKFDRITGAQRIVTAQVRAMTGAANMQEKSMRDFALRYRVRVETVPFERRPPGWAEDRMAPRAQAAMRWNLYDVRLVVNWPVLPAGQELRVGNNRKIFRTLVGGELVRTNLYFGKSDEAYLFSPNTFTNTFNTRL